MAAIIYQADKRSGLTYAYESISYWDKEEKQSRAKRRLIGRVDKESGRIVPTDGRGRKRSQAKVDVTMNSLRRFYGATYLLDEIGKKLGIANDLKACFPGSYKRILSIAYYLILEPNSPLFRFEKWSVLHKHPCDDDIPSQRSSELFSCISEDAKNRFFTLQGKHKVDKEFRAYDTTSISGYSQQLRQIQYGNNKENDLLPQLNLAIVFGESSNLPFYYRKLSGNIPDVKTVQHLLADLNNLGFDKIKLVMDRGFYCRDNINMLYKAHLKFLLSARMSLRFIKENLEPIYDAFRSFEYYDAQYELYMHTIQTQWDYEQQRAYKGDILKKKRRIYVHYYFNIDRAAEEEKAFDNRFIGLRDELLSGKRVKEHERQYAEHFIIKETPKRGIQVRVKEEVVVQAKRYYGFFAIVTNETMDARRALEIYRNKDVVEKAFGNLKERLNLRRLLVSSKQSLEGKLFVEFTALIYLSYIKKQMQEHQLFKQYTLQILLDKLDVIECFEHPNRKLCIGEILQKQKEIYQSLGVEPPVSL